MIGGLSSDKKMMNLYYNDGQRYEKRRMIGLSNDVTIVQRVIIVVVVVVRRKDCCRNTYMRTLVLVVVFMLLRVRSCLIFPGSDRTPGILRRMPIPTVQALTIRSVRHNLHQQSLQVRTSRHFYTRNHQTQFGYKSSSSLLIVNDIYYTIDTMDNDGNNNSSRNIKKTKGPKMEVNEDDVLAVSSIHQKIFYKIRQRLVRMKQGRGTEEIIMREAEALGGLPRNDRYSSRDWFHNTITLPQSVVLYNIRSPVISVTSWATFLSIVHHHLLHTSASIVPLTFITASQFYISSVPHSLMMSALGLLLVFRTNAAYQRFAEGRVIWERIVNIARDLSRMTMLYEPYIGIDKRRRIQRLVVAFPYLLRHRIRPNLVMRRIDDDSYRRDPENTILLYQDTGMKDNDPEAASLAQAEEVIGISRRKIRPLYFVDKRTLPWRLLSDNDALEKCARAQNRPLWICDRLAAEIGTVVDTPMYFTSRERLQLLKHVDALSKCIGSAERIHQTSVPLKYARHTLRALTLWLFSLPFCLLQDLKLVTGPMLFLVSWLLFGVYEIGYAIEDPFQGTLRLSILCETIRRDVLGDETIRKSAFELDTTLLQNDDNEESDEIDTYDPTHGRKDSTDAYQ